jgi:exodeoxyribonuclease V alpha subunit
MVSMRTLNDVHQQFAEYFNVPELKPYAYLLSRKLSEGHICLDLDRISEQLEGMPAYCQHMIPGSAPLRSISLVDKTGAETQPFVLYQDRLYLQRYFHYETGFLQSIKGFLAVEQGVLKERLDILNAHKAFITSLFAPDPAAPATTNTSSDPIDWQLAAAITGLLNNFTIITGGPGTGKTTTVAKILAILYATAQTLKVALAAPTGKAAARMAESLRHAKIPVDPVLAEKFQALAPSTIHRLLKPETGTPHFRYDRGNPLHFDVVIVDECSMIDVALFAKLLDAIGPSTRLILLGDKDQLASVEAGSLFGDLCQVRESLNLFTPDRLALINRFIGNPIRQIPLTRESRDDSHPLFQHLVELRHSHRFTGDTGIGKFSKAVISGDLATLQEFLPMAGPASPAPDPQVIIDPVYSRDLFEKFISGYAAFLEEKDIRLALRLMNKLRVLCAVREGEQGLYAINRGIQNYLHDRKQIQANSEFYENRPIILTRNYYEHGLFNGDTGIIRPDSKGVLMAWFEDSSGELKAVLPGYLSQAETVFAMTIHKSQGSEFDEVLVILPPSPDSPILTRELLYTAVTRAKKRVIVQGPAEVIVAAVLRFVERASGLTSRFQDLK